jgi:hypothetical protein
VNGDGSSGVGSRLEWTDAHARDVEQRATQENAERFARALAPHVTAQYRLPLGTPDGWRAGDGALTPREQPAPATASASSVTNVTAGPEGTAEAERLVVSVKSAEIGELSLVLDRRGGALRVVIGVADARSAEAMLPERDALLRQLEHSGLRVESLQIVQQSQVGTVLAPPRTIGGPRGPEQRSHSDVERAEREERENARRRGSRKLNVVG